MRILVLSQYYDPEPLLRPVEIAEELVRRGHEVVVLTGLPNYPTGHLAPGYRLSAYQRERIRDVDIVRSYEFPYHGRSAVRRMLNYLSFAFSAIPAAFTLKRPDVVFVCHPPLTIGLAAWALKTLRRAPYVYDVQDIWPDAVLMSGLMREGRIANMMRKLELFAYRHAAAVVVVTKGARQNLLNKSVSADKIHVIPPWAYGAPEDAISPTEIDRAKLELGAAGRFTVTFAGNIGLVQGLDVLIDAAEILRDRDDIAFRVIGDGVDRERLVARCQSLQLRNFQFLGARPASVMPALLAASDALLVHLRGGPLTNLYLPAKTFSYLAAARPIIMAMTGEAADLVRACEAGVVVPPDDPAAMAVAVNDLFMMPAARRAAMGAAGLQCVTSRFTRARVMDQIEIVLASVATPP